MENIDRGAYSLIWSDSEGDSPILGNGVIILGVPQVGENDIAPAYCMDETEYDEIHDTDGRTQGNVYITSDLSSACAKLEDEVDASLQELKRSQESEYRLAEERLYTQKNYLISLYQQLEAERSELASPATALPGRNSDHHLNNVLNRVDQIKHEEAKLKEMMKVAEGFGRTPKNVLSDHYGLPVMD